MSDLIAEHLPIEAPDGVETWDVDPYDEAVLTNPDDYYATLRAKGDVVYLSRYSALAVGRFEPTREVFSDHVNFLSSRGVGLADLAVGENWRPPSIILEADPPDHTKARKVLGMVTSPRSVRELGELFLTTARELVDEVLAKGVIDGVNDLAEKYPTRVFPKAVGMRDVNERHLIDYGAMVFNSIGPDNEIRQRSMARAAEIIPWITAACARERLFDEGLGAQLYACADAGDITHEEASLLMRSFLSAGVDTTVTGIGSALWCFAQAPEQWELLKKDPGLIRSAFEEVLRFTSPVHTFCRTAARDTEVAGVRIKGATKVLCVLGAANMDPAHWGDPENFRVDRDARGHLAFGAGIHRCVGQYIARAELEALLTVMVEKIDQMEPAGDPVWRPNNAMHALDSLPLRLSAN